MQSYWGEQQQELNDAASKTKTKSCNALSNKNKN